MKTRVLSGLAFLSVTMAFAVSCKTAAETTPVIIDNGIRFCESTLPYDGGILIANFGTEELNPLNSEGKGYIVFWKNGKTETIVPADGNLSAPKGMFCRDNYLYICDVNKVAVYQIGNGEGIFVKSIAFPEGNLFVNDLAASGNFLYASVTNTDRIFRIDITDIANPGEAQEWFQAPGPNGLLVSEGVLYVASDPADGNTQDKHVIYRIADLKNPELQKVVATPGQYDGIALSSDGKSLYVTNWTLAGLSEIDMESGELATVEVGLEKPFIGPADISVSGGRIFIPDLPNSRVIIIGEPSADL